MRRSSIIIGAIAVVVLSAGIALLAFWPEPGTDPEPPQPTPVQTDLNTTLINISYDDVAEIMFQPADSSSYILRLIPDSDEIELDAEDAVFPADQEMLEFIFFFAVILQNLTVVTDNADDSQLAIFGLDNPVMTWRVSCTNGTNTDVIIGAQQAAGNNRYASLKNGREVFLLNDAQSFALTREIKDLLDFSFFPHPPSTDDMPTWILIENILLETDENNIEIRRRTEEELMAADFGSSVMQMLQPYQAECNDYIVQRDLFEPVTYIMPSRIEAIRPASLTAYGLDNPDRLTVTTDDWNATLLIGDRDPENGGRFIMIEGHDAVLYDSTGNYSFLNVELSRIRAQLMWLFDITSVSSVLFKLDEVTRILKFEHDPENQSLRGWLDDNELSETNARRLYMGALSVTQAGSTDAAIPAEKPVYSITINMTDRSSRILELYQISDSQYLIVVNGSNTGFFISRLILQQNLLSRFDALDAGNDIP